MKMSFFVCLLFPCLTHFLALSSRLLLFYSQGLGSLSFQSFHQRTLSASSSQTDQLTCYAAAIVIAILGIPPVLIGAVAASTGGIS